MNSSRFRSFAILAGLTVIAGAQASAELRHTALAVEPLAVAPGEPIHIIEVVEPADLYRWKLDVGIDAQVRILSELIAQDQRDRIEQAAIDKRARLLAAVEPSQ